MTPAPHDHTIHGEPVLPCPEGPFPWFLQNSKERDSYTCILNYQDMHPDDVHQAISDLIAWNPAYYIHSFCMIRDEDSQLQPFNRWNAGQRRLWDEGIAPSWYGDEAVLLLVIKPRQIGSSTLLTALDLWVTGTHGRTSGVVYAHQDPIHKTLFQMVRRFYLNLPPWLRPQTVASSRMELIFNNKEGTGLDSHIYVSLAGASEGTSEGRGRGDTLRLAHLSEIDHYKYPEALQGSLQPSLKKQHGTFILEESTANGIGGYCDKKWQRCMERTNNYNHVFLSWKDIPWRPTKGGGWARKYSAQLPCTPSEYVGTLSGKELDFIQDHDLTLEQVEWWRQALEECQGDENKRQQEYPPSIEDAFVSSGELVFSHSSLAWYEKESKKIVPAAEGQMALVDGKLFLDPKPDGPLRIYRYPAPDKTYVIGADPAKGYDSGDFSALSVLCRETQEFVAHYYAHHDPEKLAEQASYLGWYYNSALVVPEIPGPGEAMIYALRRVFRYPRIYVRRDLKFRSKPIRDRYGYDNNGSTRPTLVTAVRVAINKQEVMVYDPRLLAECRRFQVVDGREDHAPGAHDDLIFSAAFALRGHAEYGQQADPKTRKEREARKAAVKMAGQLRQQGALVRGGVPD